MDLGSGAPTAQSFPGAVDAPAYIYGYLGVSVYPTSNGKQNGKKRDNNKLR